MKTNNTTTSVNRQIVIRDTPKGIPVKTQIKAGKKCVVPEY